MDHNIKLILSYLGTRYLGWQKTVTGPTIEGELSRALAVLEGTAPVLQAASRTDAGVHAQQQVVQCVVTFPLEQLLYKLNALLPRDIRVRHLEEVEPSFHPSLDCKRKTYTYQICLGKVQLPFFRKISWHIPHKVDLSLMDTASRKLVGEHDFAAFCNDLPLWRRSTICRLEEISFIRLPHQRIEITVIGDHFLYRMVRNLVGTLLDIGKGKEFCLQETLASRDRRRAGVSAPAHGLCLQQVDYL